MKDFLKRPDRRLQSRPSAGPQNIPDIEEGKTSLPFGRNHRWWVLGIVGIGIV
jgi:hypothetical protein